MADNPLRGLRERRGWTILDAALALGVAYRTAWEADKGLPRTLPRSVCEGLARLGLDARQAAAEYRAWREQFRETATHC